MPINKYGDEKKRKASEDYRAKHGYDPSPDQLSTFIATTGFMTGDSGSGPSVDSVSCDTSTSFDGGASASGSCDVSGGIG